MCSFEFECSLVKEVWPVLQQPKVALNSPDDIVKHNIVLLNSTRRKDSCMCVVPSVI